MDWYLTLHAMKLHGKQSMEKRHLHGKAAIVFEMRQVPGIDTSTKNRLEAAWFELFSTGVIFISSNAIEKLIKRHSQRYRNLSETKNGNVALAVFNSTKIGPVNSRVFTQRRLTQAHIFTLIADSEPQADKKWIAHISYLSG